MYMNEELIQEKLEEMNATKIQKLDSQMYLVNFDLKEDMRISYVFNITREGKYFLQRMRPYSMVHGKFSNEYEVLSFIKHDVEKFQNAANSTNFIKFLEISNKGLQLTEEIENAFLNYNVDGEIHLRRRQRWAYPAKTHRQFRERRTLPGPPADRV